MTTDTILSDIAQYTSQFSTDQFLNQLPGVVYTGLQMLPNAPKEALFKWNQPGNVGNTGGGSTKAHGTFSWTPDINTQFSCHGAPNQEDNFYMYMLLPLPPTLPQQIVDYRFHKIDNMANWQGLEWQQQLTLGGKTWNCGAWQFSLTSGVRIWNHQDKKWNPAPANVPFPDFTKGVRTRCEYLLTPTTMTHVSITINGVEYPVNVIQNAVPTTDSDKFTIAEQIDPKKGSVCNLTIGQLELRYL